MARFNRLRRRSALTMPEVSLTPLIDTALTLLIIFMVTTPMLQNVIKVNLPKSKTKEADKTNQELIVYIDKQSKLYFNGKEVEKRQLTNLVQEQLKSVAEPGVFVKADGAVVWEYMSTIVDQIKEVKGVKYVALVRQECS